MKAPPARLLLSFCVAALMLFSRSSASAHLLQAFPELGDLEHWAVFSLGGNITESNPTDDASGNVNIFGDVGVAGSGNITLSGRATIHGNLDYHTGGKYTHSGSSSVTGRTYQDNSSLDRGVKEANSTSSDAATFRSSAQYANTKNINLSGGSSLTLFAYGSPQRGDPTVLNLQNFSLSGNSVLTLQGTAKDLFILNVSSQFSLSGNSRIQLSGGLHWDDVLFNITGTGSNVAISGNARMTGMLMANKRTISLSGNSEVDGEVIANRIAFSGGATVKHLPQTSP